MIPGGVELIGDGYTVYRIKEGYTLRNFFDEYLVIPVGLSEDIETKVGILNSVGEVIWKTLQKDSTFQDLLAAVMKEFDVKEEEASKDIEEFLEQLDQYKFLEKRQEEKKNERKK